MIVTHGMSYIFTSCAISAIDAAIYFAAEPYPGVWSVCGRSLSIDLGIPANLISELMLFAYADSLFTVSMESFPPI